MAIYEQALKQRLSEYGLEVAKEKTKTFGFGRNGGPRNGRFDFLGFEFSWGKSRKGRPIVKRRTARKKMRAGEQKLTDWIRTKRHQKVRQVMKALGRKLRGTWNYLWDPRQLEKPEPVRLLCQPHCIQMAEQTQP